MVLTYDCSHLKVTALRIDIKSLFKIRIMQHYILRTYLHLSSPSTWLALTFSFASFPWFEQVGVHFFPKRLNRNRSFPQNSLLGLLLLVWRIHYNMYLGRLWLNALATNYICTQYSLPFALQNRTYHHSIACRPSLIFLKPAWTPLGIALRCPL